MSEIVLNVYTFTVAKQSLYRLTGGRTMIEIGGSS